MPYLTRRAYLRSEVARCFANVTMQTSSGTSRIEIAERTVPPGDAIRGAFRCGDQEMTPVGEGRQTAEAGIMTGFVRVEFRTTEADELQDDVSGLVEDALEHAIESYLPPAAKWEHPLSRETVEIRRIERTFLIPANAADKATGFVIIPFAVVFQRSRRRRS